MTAMMHFLVIFVYWGCSATHQENISNRHALFGTVMCAHHQTDVEDRATTDACRLSDVYCYLRNADKYCDDYV